MKPAFLIILMAIFAFSFSCNQEQSGDTNTTEETTHDHDSATEQASNTASKPLSPRTNAMANIGDAHVHIDYSSPSVRGRVIWGGLVALDQVWVTGAHKATSIDFSKDVMIDGQKIEAGKYGFFTIPGKESWTLILNKNHDQHLADDYDESLDVLRLQVTPEELPEPVESLTYQLTPTGDQTGTISVMWDQLKVSFEIRTL